MRRPLTDGERDTLRELEADARYGERAVSELVDECDTFGEVLCELADADRYTPEPFDQAGTTVEMDDEFPW